MTVCWIPLSHFHKLAVFVYIYVRGLKFSKPLWVGWHPNIDTLIVRLCAVGSIRFPMKISVCRLFENLYISLLTHILASTNRFAEMPTNNYIESSFWNFDALFQPQQHPARDAHDTFFLKGNVKSCMWLFYLQHSCRSRKVVWIS